MNVNWYKSRETVLFLFAEAVAGLSFFHSSLYELCVFVCCCWQSIAYRSSVFIVAYFVI